MKAKDIMSRELVTLTPLTDVAAAARLLTERCITGAPVVDAQGRLVGVVSQTDLTRFQGQASADGWGRGGLQSEERDSTPVVSVMTDKPICCDEDTPTEEVARLMLERHIHRVLVTKDGKLVGVVSAMDILRALVAAQDAP